MKIDDMIQKDEAPEVENISFEDDTTEDSGGGLIDLLKTPTGEGDVSEYLNHPLNFNSSNAMARIIRGMTGFLGNMNYAVADIVVGVLEFMKLRPGSPAKNSVVQNETVH